MFCRLQKYCCKFIYRIIWNPSALKLVHQWRWVLLYQLFLNWLSFSFPYRWCLFSISLTELSAVLQEVVSVTVSTIHYSNAYHSIQYSKDSHFGWEEYPRSSQHKLPSFLLSYRTTPHSVTGIPPSVLLYGRRPKTVLDILKPDMSNTVRKKQESQKRVQDRLIEVG